MVGTIEINGTGGILEGNLAAAAVNVNLDVPYTAIHETFGSGTPQTITIPHDNDLDGSNIYTFMAWVKSSATSATTGAGGTGNASFATIAQINDSWKLGLHDSGKPYFFWYGSSTVNENTWGNAFTLVGAGWTHVCVVVNTSGGTVNGHANNTATLYQNGVARSSTLTVGGNASDEGGNILIHSKAYNDEILYGNIMDVKLYNAVLSADEIKIAASKINIDSTIVSSTAPQIWAKLNTGATGSVASAIGGTATVGSGFSDTNDYDAFSVNVQDGLVSAGGTTTDGAVTVTQGKLEGKALSCVDLDGSAEYIAVSDAAGLSFGDGSDDSPFSISACIRADANNFPIISKGHYNSGSGEYTLYVNSSGYLAFELWDESVASCYIGQRYETAITLNQWIHITGTYSAPAGGGAGATDGVKLYIDGVLVSSADYEGNEGSYDAMENLTADVQIGRLDNTYANGEIRDVRIYDYELSADQASSLYSGSYNATPKYWWKLDEGHTTEGTVDASGAFEDSGTGTDADGTGTNLDADSCQNGTLDLDSSLTIGGNNSATSNSDWDRSIRAYLSAPRGELTIHGNLSNYGSFIHNNGLVKHTLSAAVQDISNGRPIRFYDYRSVVNTTWRGNRAYNYSQLDMGGNLAADVTTVVMDGTENLEVGDYLRIVTTAGDYEWIRVIEVTNATTIEVERGKLGYPSAACSNNANMALLPVCKFEGTYTNPVSTTDKITGATQSAADQEVPCILEFGTETTQGTFENLGTFRFAENTSGANEGSNVGLGGANSLYPMIMKSNGTDIDWGDDADFDGVPIWIMLWNLDYQIACSIGGTNNLAVKLVGDCEFDALTVEAGVTLDIN